MPSPVVGRTEIISGLQNECDRQAENPPSVDGEPDRYISMFAGALRSVLEDLPVSSQDHLAASVNFKKSKGPFTSKFAFNFILRNIQMNLMHDPENLEEYDLSYPYETPEEWNERVHELLSDEKEFRDLTYNMIMWNVGSDVETRVAGIKLVAHTLLSDQVNDENNPFRILNVGSARNHSLAMLSGNIELPEVEITGRGLGRRKQQYLQNVVNELLAREIHLGDSYGVDLRSLRDEEWGEFLESCRFYPSELRDPKKRHMYKYLEEVRDADPRLHHVVAEYGKDKADFGSRSNLVAYITSLHQSHPDKQRDMVDQGLDDGDFVMIQDFCKVISSDTRKHPIDQLEFMGPSSNPYTYGLFVYDPKKPKSGVQTLGYWNNGRCEKFQPTELFIETVA